MRLIALLIFASALLCGCGSKPPPPLAIEEVPAALRKEFASAKTFVKKSAETIAQQVTKEEYAPASVQLQALTANTDITESQRDIASRALVAVNLKLQELAESIQPTAEGAPPSAPPASPEKAAEAAAAQQHYILTK